MNLGKTYFGLVVHLRKNDMISCDNAMELNSLVSRTAHNKELLKTELKKKLRKMIPEYKEKKEKKLGKIHFIDPETQPPILLCMGWQQTKTRVTDDPKQVTCKNCLKKLERENRPFQF